MKIPSNKVIVVTGATKGIGKCFADTLNCNNNIVISLARSAADNGETSFPCDVSDKARVEEVFDKIASLYGHIDILINNAGYGVSGATEFLSEDVAKGVMNVNYFGTLFCSQAALKYMPSGSRIYNISSMSAYAPMPFRTLYSTSKAAINMLTLGMRLETKPFGVDISSICFGDIKTDFLNHRVFSAETNERYGNRIKIADDFAENRQQKNVKMDLDKAVGKGVRIISKKHTRQNYVIGFKFKIVYLLYRLIPNSLIVYLVSKIFNRTK